MLQTTRREDRENLFQTVYEAQIKETSCLEILKTKVNESDFVDQMCKYIDENLETAKEFYKPHLKDWTWDRIPLVDRSILTIAYCEVKCINTPMAVVCNEAVEIAKTYGGDKSYKFINGILKHLES